jgi:excisionase family DNA binding protein
MAGAVGDRKLAQVALVLPSTLLDAEAVASRLGIGVWAVHELLKDGSIAGSKIGRRWRVEATEVEAFIARSRARPQQRMAK